ncbi:CoA transferase [Phenylobacterium sp. LjRoot225]|uniref:CaiB/BaiF CoA transferase family protein n=1 Tax=Phenylobacterium sp. LjRoot225 TaxID=3342285 RepID=UPI003ECF61CC
MDTLDNSTFAGVRVVELAQFVFVPGGGAILADLGAEVIKIEEPKGGDPYRSLKINDGRQTASANLAMEQNNRGKKSLAVDLKTPEGREVFLRLIATADVFLTSIRPDAIERLGLGVEALRAHNPKLIYVRGNGTGFRGPQANRAGYDASCFWARGGFAEALRPQGAAQPISPRPALGDHAGSTNIALGIAAALFRRERTGEPSLIEVSLLSTATWILSADIVMSKVPGYNERVANSNVTRQPLTRAYRCADDRWIQLMFLDPDRYWPGLCQRLGRPELAQDPRYASVDLRSEHGLELHAVLAEIFAEQPARSWGEAFAGWDAPWEFIQSISEVAEDPEVIANGHFFDVEVSDGTKVQLVTGPVSVDGSARPAHPRRAPLKGEHTMELLGDAGVDRATLEQLQKTGVLG